MRTPFIVSLFLIGTSSIIAQPEVATVIRLTIDPAAEPTPALRYRLLPELRDKTSGNAATLYYRAMAPEWSPETRLARDKKMRKLLDVWAEDTGKTPPTELKWVLVNESLKEIDRGARRTYCDWEQLARLRKKGLNMLMPDIQSLRLYGQLLALRARFQMQNGDFRGAMHSMQTGFALSRHIAEGPTAIYGLVGIAVNSMMMEQLEAMIGMPGSPNLYSALTNTPKPFVDLRNGFEGERIIVDWLLPGVRNALQSGKPMPRGAAVAVARKFADEMNELSGIKKTREESTVPKINHTARADIAIMAAKAYPHGRVMLLEQGWPAKVVDELPTVEVWLLLEVYNNDLIYDDYFKWSGLPFWEAQRKMSEESGRIDDEIRRGYVGIGRIFGALTLPAIQRVHASMNRPDRRIAALRCVEAIRLYAAKHNKLPAKLSDITEVPIPIDPATGKSFLYQMNRSRCVLHTHENEYGDRLSSVLRYEILLRKPKNK